MYFNQNKANSVKTMSEKSRFGFGKTSVSGFKNESILYRLVNASVSYKDLFALKNISLSICSGDFIFVT